MNTDYFVTGNEYVRESLDLKYIPRANLSDNDNWGEVSLADTNQDLNQGFLAAKNFFANAEPKSIKFVLIGLSPYLVSDREPLVVCKVEEKVLEDYVKLCFDNGAIPVVFALPVHPALKNTYKADVLKLFRDTINKVMKKTNWKAKFIDLLNVGLSDKLFKDKMHLNLEGSTAVTALLSERLYFRGIISAMEICGAGKDFFNVLAKYFSHERDFWCDDRPLPHHIFSKLAYEDFNRLSKIMPKETCMDLMVQVFYELNYSYLACLADMLPKEDYIELTTRLFNMTAENIRRKDKIKVGFYFEFSSHWCGDDLYNAFAKDGRFEPTIFVPTDNSQFDSNAFSKDAEKYKARGLNVFEMKNHSLDVPQQDILFRTRPYPEYVLPAFTLANLKVKETLLIYIAYALHVSQGPLSLPLHNVLWRMFYSSVVEMDEGKKKNKFGMPRGVYSGYPKQDIFFKPDSKFHFDWKTTRPDAKKIIWAPHWSITTGALYSTFQWNYKFMYEYAKAHSEISWVVKPHPLLFMSAVWAKIFPSKEALKEYFQKWDDLPNARVYTGTYYYDIFATSDGMIQDSGSFLAEYQYVDKPMIYLVRRGGGVYNKLGEEILKASYTIDGQDLDAIAAMIQRVFIKGDDYKAAERKAVFDKYLNYPKLNGMLASEFIFKNIADELKGAAK